MILICFFTKKTNNKLQPYVPVSYSVKNCEWQKCKPDIPLDRFDETIQILVGLIWLNNTIDCNVIDGCLLPHSVPLELLLKLPAASSSYPIIYISSAKHTKN